jgi:hypothetical protein
LFGDWYDVPRGSFITSQEKLKKKWKWGRRQFEKFILLCVQSNFFTIENRSYKCTSITIVNYDTYQGIDQADVQATVQAAIKPRSSHCTINKNEKNDKKEKILAEPQVERPRNEVWDCVIETFKFNPVTKNELSRIGKVVADLKEKGATPERIQKVYAHYKRKWPEIDCTPEALVKHWDMMKADILAQKVNKEFTY